MYTVIATAFRSNNSLGLNRSRNHHAIYKVKESVRLLGRVVHCDGYYREDISEVATSEESMIFTVGTLEDVAKLRELFCGQFEQDCILAVGNGEAKLLGADWDDTIGTHFQAVQSIEGLNAYTKLFDGTILKVA